VAQQRACCTASLIVTRVSIGADERGSNVQMRRSDWIVVATLLATSQDGRQHWGETSPHGCTDNVRLLGVASVPQESLDGGADPACLCQRPQR
jgi:hypothetical protein